MARTLNPEDLRKPCDPKPVPLRDQRRKSPRSRASSARDGRSRRSISASTMRSLGFNIYVLGESGTGKTPPSAPSCRRRRRPTLFRPIGPTYSTSGSPRAIALFPAPRRREWNSRTTCGNWLEYLRSAIPKVFDSKEYERQKGRIVEGFQGRQKEIFGSLEEEAK